MLDLRLRPRLARRAPRSSATRSGACAWAIPTRSPGPSAVDSSNRSAELGHRLPPPRTRVSGTTSPSVIVSTGLTFRSCPASAARAADPPALGEEFERVDGEEQAGVAGVALDERLDLLVGRAPLEPALDREREHRDRRRGGPRVEQPHALAAELLRGEAARSRRCRRGSRRCGATGSARSRRAPRRPRGSPAAWAATWSAARRAAQAVVEGVRAELDVVAEALLAEADVERHDPHVREARRRVGEVGGRVEHDRRVRACEVHAAARSSAAPLDGAHDLVERLILPQAGDGAGLAAARTPRARPADAVRQTTAARRTLGPHGHASPRRRPSPAVGSP